MLTGVKDVDLLILSKLDDETLVKVCQVNKKAREICNDENFWLERIQIQYPYIPTNILRKNKKRHNTWSQYYIKDLRRINPSNAIRKLKYGAKTGRLDHIMIAMNKGADINQPANDFGNRFGDKTVGETAVIWAATTGDLDAVKYLRGQGVNIDYDYAVTMARKNGHLDVMRYLIRTRPKMLI